jgi:hypothetical protein
MYVEVIFGFCAGTPLIGLVVLALGWHRLGVRNVRQQEAGGHEKSKGHGCAVAF